MTARFRMAGALASLAVVAGMLRCLWLWQPERQLLLHQQHFLQAAENRNWSRLGAAIDPDYADRWGYHKASAMAQASEWLRQFFALTITASSITPRLSPGGGTVSERLVFDGTGTALAQMARDGVNQIQAPWTFEWRHAGWKPWAWTLIRVENPEVRIEGPPPGF